MSKVQLVTSHLHYRQQGLPPSNYPQNIRQNEGRKVIHILGSEERITPEGLLTMQSFNKCIQSLEGGISGGKFERDLLKTEG